MQCLYICEEYGRKMNILPRRKEKELGDNVFDLQIRHSLLSYDHLHIIVRAREQENLWIETRNGQQERVMTLPMQDVSAVADAIRKMHAVFHDPNYYIEAANMFDGYDYQIYLSDGQDAYAVLTDNLKVHLERHSPNAEKLIMLIYEVFDILERNGVERDILQIK